MRLFPRILNQKRVWGNNAKDMAMKTVKKLQNGKKDTYIRYKFFKNCCRGEAILIFYDQTFMLLLFLLGAVLRLYLPPDETSFHQTIVSYYLFTKSLIVTYL